MYVDLTLSLLFLSTFVEDIMPYDLVSTKRALRPMITIASHPLRPSTEPLDELDKPHMIPGQTQMK